MALYQDYETKLLTENSIDVQNDGTKRDIELYNPEQILQLPVESLERIQDFLDDYNYLTGQTFKLRYYQVLALLFTEQFFADQQSNGYNENNREETQRMLAYWMATGSGKTLVMHLNILQYLHHFCRKDNARLQIFLTTPLANLTKQHERELEPYIRQLNEIYHNRIELIINTTQGLLQKENDYFHLPDDSEVCRLILVDEAHIGLNSGEAGKFKDEQYDNDLTAHCPLMAFMGHTVENPKEEGKNNNDEVSDIQKVLDYLAALTEAERQKFRSIFGGNIIGPLVVSRNPDNNSELLLSYGDGEKWGMINVGDAMSFYNSITNDHIETRVEAIENPSLHFENLDNETSPINVLIGSRKFAEGWNSYRLSVIGLINLGSSKGNLIIQIFGRGVRLRGKGGDGKRQYIDHKPDYHFPYQNVESNIRRLETLTVYSLKQSYLKQFLDEVHAGGVSLQHVFKIQVNPMLFKIDSSTSVYEYTVTKKFPTQDELDTFLEQVENAESDALQENPHAQIKNKLQLPLPRGHRHIYLPLMRPQEEVENEHRDVKVSPDRLNAGEKKFVEDLTDYIKLNYQRNEKYEFYLMRNAQKIGIYLESDAGSYYPDFVLWVLDTQQDITHILFIDPKGEREIIGGTRGDYKNHPKVKLAQKSEDQTLVTLEKRLAAEQGRKFCMNSFLLLRNSSELGRGETSAFIEDNMLSYNILRLDWHGKTEDGSTSRLFESEKSYLDLMFEKAGIQQ